MKFQKFIGWMAGNEDLPEINRIYNVACIIAMLFSLMAGVESAIASLNPILIANNFFYSFLLAVLFYLSRFKQKFGVSRFVNIVVLLFIYTPILWIYNGGSTSGIPYYILLFASFLTILIVADQGARRNQKQSGVILIFYSLIITGLILLEYFFPNIFYKYDNRSSRFFDIIVSMLFALAGNFFILRSFIELYYKQLDKVKEYSTRLEELVVRDSMTNLYNHAFVMSRLSDEVEKARRYQRPLSVLMLDIDHFKQINDTHGHFVGDEVLIKLASTIHSSCRSVDIIARYGGEEFLILLPETNETSAGIIANRLKVTIHNLSFSRGITVTVSGGVTQYQSGDTTSSMIERVDALLYRAKEEGRDRIVMGQSENSPVVD